MSKMYFVSVDAVTFPVVHSALLLLANTASTIAADMQREIQLQVAKDAEENKPQDPPPIDNAYVAPGCERFSEPDNFKLSDAETGS